MKLDRYTLVAILATGRKFERSGAGQANLVARARQLENEGARGEVKEIATGRVIHRFGGSDVS